MRLIERAARASIMPRAASALSSLTRLKNHFEERFSTSAAIGLSTIWPKFEMRKATYRTGQNNCSVCRVIVMARQQCADYNGSGEVCGYLRRINMLLLRENVRSLLNDNVRLPLHGCVINNQPRLCACAAAFAPGSTSPFCVTRLGAAWNRRASASTSRYVRRRAPA